MEKHCQQHGPSTDSDTFELKETMTTQKLLLSLEKIKKRLDSQLVKSKKTTVKKLQLVQLVTKDFLLNHADKNVQLLTASLITDLFVYFSPFSRNRTFDLWDTKVNNQDASNTFPFSDKTRLKEILLFLVKQVELLSQSSSPSVCKPRMLLIKKMTSVNPFRFSNCLDSSDDVLKVLLEQIIAVIRRRGAESKTITEFSLTTIPYLVSPDVLLPTGILKMLLKPLITDDQNVPCAVVNFCKVLLEQQSVIFRNHTNAYLKAVLKQLIGISEVREKDKGRLWQRFCKLLRILWTLSRQLVDSCFELVERQLLVLRGNERLRLANTLRLMFSSQHGCELIADHPRLWQTFILLSEDNEVELRRLCAKALCDVSEKHGRTVVDPALKDCLLKRSRDVDHVVRGGVMTAIAVVLKQMEELDRALIECLVERSRDVKFEVREIAMSELGKVYNSVWLAKQAADGVEWIPGKILPIYCTDPVTDRIVVEKVVHHYFIPRKIDVDRRAQRLLSLWKNLDPLSRRCFEQILRTRELLRTLLRPSVELLSAGGGGSMSTSGQFNEEAVDRNHTDKTISLSEQHHCIKATSATFASERLRKLSELLTGRAGTRVNRTLLQLLNKCSKDDVLLSALVQVTQVDCTLESGVASLKTFTRKSSIPENVLAFIDRLVPIVDDKLVDVLITKTMLSSTQQQRQCFAASASSLLEMLSKYSHVLFERGSVLTSLTSMVVNGTPAVADNVVQLLSRIKIDSLPAEQRSALYVALVNIMVSGSVKQAKHALLCSFNILPRGELKQKLQCLLQKLIDCLRKTPGSRASWLAVVGHLAQRCFSLFSQDPRLVDWLFSFVVDELKIGKNKLVCGRYSAVTCESKDEKIQGLKMLTRCAIGAKNIDITRRVLQLLRGLIAATDDTAHGGASCSGDQLALQLQAACCLLRIAQEPVLCTGLVVEDMFNLSVLISSGPSDSSSTLVRKVHLGLHRLRLPIFYGSLLCFAALWDESSQSETNESNVLLEHVRQMLLTCFAKRRQLLSTSGGNLSTDTTVESLLPEYTVPYAIYLLAFWIQTGDNIDLLIQAGRCLQFLIGCLTQKCRFSSAFYSRMFDMIRQSKTTASPKVSTSNKKLHTVCELARAIVLTMKSPRSAVSECYYPSQIVLPADLYIDFKPTRKLEKIDLPLQILDVLFGKKSKKRKQSGASSFVQSEPARKKQKRNSRQSPSKSKSDQFETEAETDATDEYAAAEKDVVAAQGDSAQNSCVNINSSTRRLASPVTTSRGLSDGDTDTPPDEAYEIVKKMQLRLRPRRKTMQFAEKSSESDSAGNISDTTSVASARNRNSLTEQSPQSRTKTKAEGSKRSISAAQSVTTPGGNKPTKKPSAVAARYVVDPDLDSADDFESEAVVENGVQSVSKNGNSPQPHVTSASFCTEKLASCEDAYAFRPSPSSSLSKNMAVVAYLQVVSSETRKEVKKMPRRRAVEKPYNVNRGATGRRKLSRPKNNHNIAEGSSEVCDPVDFDAGLIMSEGQLEDANVDNVVDIPPEDYTPAVVDTERNHRQKIGVARKTREVSHLSDVEHLDSDRSVDMNVSAVAAGRSRSINCSATASVDRGFDEPEVDCTPDAIDERNLDSDVGMALTGNEGTSPRVGTKQASADVFSKDDIPPTDSSLVADGSVRHVERNGRHLVASAKSTIVRCEESTTVSSRNVGNIFPGSDFGDRSDEIPLLSASRESIDRYGELSSDEDQQQTIAAARNVVENTSGDVKQSSAAYRGVNNRQSVVFAKRSDLALAAPDHNDEENLSPVVRDLEIGENDGDVDRCSDLTNKQCHTSRSVGQLTGACTAVDKIKQFTQFAARITAAAGGTIDSIDDTVMLDVNTTPNSARSHSGSIPLMSVGSFVDLERNSEGDGEWSAERSECDFDSSASDDEVGESPCHSLNSSVRHVISADDDGSRFEQKNTIDESAAAGRVGYDGFDNVGDSLSSANRTGSQNILADYHTGSSPSMPFESVDVGGAAGNDVPFSWHCVSSPCESDADDMAVRSQSYDDVTSCRQMSPENSESQISLSLSKSVGSSAESCRPAAVLSRIHETRLTSSFDLSDGSDVSSLLSPTSASMPSSVVSIHKAATGDSSDVTTNTRSLACMSQISSQTSGMDVVDVANDFNGKQETFVALSARDEADDDETTTKCTARRRTTQTSKRIGKLSTNCVREEHRPTRTPCPVDRVSNVTDCGEDTDFRRNPLEQQQQQGLTEVTDVEIRKAQVTAPIEHSEVAGGSPNTRSEVAKSRRNLKGDGCGTVSSATSRRLSLRNRPNAGARSTESSGSELPLARSVQTFGAGLQQSTSAQLDEPGAAMAPSDVGVKYTGCADASCHEDRTLRGDRRTGSKSTHGNALSVTRAETSVEVTSIASEEKLVVKHCSEAPVGNLDRYELQPDKTDVNSTRPDVRRRLDVVDESCQNSNITDTNVEEVSNPAVRAEEHSPASRKEDRFSPAADTRERKSRATRKEKIDIGRRDMLDNDDKSDSSKKANSARRRSTKQQPLETNENACKSISDERVNNCKTDKTVNGLAADSFPPVDAQSTSNDSPPGGQDLHQRSTRKKSASMSKDMNDNIPVELASLKNSDDISERGSIGKRKKMPAADKCNSIVSDKVTITVTKSKPLSSCTPRASGGAKAKVDRQRGNHQMSAGQSSDTSDTREVFFDPSGEKGQEEVASTLTTTDDVEVEIAQAANMTSSEISRKGKNKKMRLESTRSTTKGQSSQTIEASHEDDHGAKRSSAGDVPTSSLFAENVTLATVAAVSKTSRQSSRNRLSTKSAFGKRQREGEVCDVVEQESSGNDASLTQVDLKARPAPCGSEVLEDQVDVVRTELFHSPSTREVTRSETASSGTDRILQFDNKVAERCDSGAVGGGSGGGVGIVIGSARDATFSLMGLDESQPLTEDEADNAAAAEETTAICSKLVSTGKVSSVNSSRNSHSMQSARKSQQRCSQPVDSISSSRTADQFVEPTVGVSDRGQRSAARSDRRTTSTVSARKSSVPVFLFDSRQSQSTVRRNSEIDAHRSQRESIEGQSDGLVKSSVPDQPLFVCRSQLSSAEEAKSSADDGAEFGLNYSTSNRNLNAGALKSTTCEDGITVKSSSVVEPLFVGRSKSLHPDVISQTRTAERDFRAAKRATARTVSKMEAESMAYSEPEDPYNTTSCGRLRAVMSAVNSTDGHPTPSGRVRTSSLDDVRNEGCSEWDESQSYHEHDAVSPSCAIVERPPAANAADVDGSSVVPNVTDISPLTSCWRKASEPADCLAVCQPESSDNTLPDFGAGVTLQEHYWSSRRNRSELNTRSTDENSVCTGHSLDQRSNVCRVHVSEPMRAIGSKESTEPHWVVEFCLESDLDPNGGPTTTTINEYRREPSLSTNQGPEDNDLWPLNEDVRASRSSPNRETFVSTALESDIEDDRFELGDLFEDSSHSNDSGLPSSQPVVGKSVQKSGFCDHRTLNDDDDNTLGRAPFGNGNSTCTSRELSRGGDERTITVRASESAMEQVRTGQVDTDDIPPPERGNGSRRHRSTRKASVAVPLD